MPLVTRRTDVCTGHGCWPPRPPCSWSPDVFANNLEAIRINDCWEVHCCPPCHGGTSVGTHTVFVNGRDWQVTGDPIDCGSSDSVHSPDVTVDGA